MWWLKLIVSMLIDLFDMTVGRVMFATPFLGEIIGVVVGSMMFGPKAWWYALEALDPTEQIDGFIPTATLIALNSRDD
jgi:hypothetical protein